MNAIGLIVTAALGVGICALALLIWALRSGQYDDMEGDAARILLDDSGTDTEN